MADLKTRPTKRSVTDFVKSIADDERRRDCRNVMRIMKSVTKARPKMWGPSIIGYGTYHFKYASGREADWFITGFSPRKQALTIYVMSGFSKYKTLLKKLGKHRTGQSCLYIMRLSDVDLDVLTLLIRGSMKHLMGAAT